jgi:hypothetical protein
MKRSVCINLCACVVLLSGLVGVAHGQVENTFTEDFTTTAYRDPINTTADWDTTASELKLFSFVPASVGFYSTPNTASGVAISGNYAYVADNESMQILQISNPTFPLSAGSYHAPTLALSVFADGNHVFLTDWFTGLHILDITNPASPAVLAVIATPGNAQDVVVDGDYAFVADRFSGLQIIDISNPAIPSIVGAYDTPGNAFGVQVAGDLAFVADGASGLQVIDISNPAAPTLMGAFDTVGTAQGLFVDGNHVFVAGDFAGLQVFDISNPAIPALISTFDTPGTALGVYVDGDCAFVADFSAGIHAIDISNPASPTLEFTYNTPGSANRVVVAGEHAFVGDSQTFQVIQVRLSTGPTLAANYTTQNFAQNLFVDGNHAFVADTDSGLIVVDISDPTVPTFVSSFPMSGAREVFVAGDHAYVADDDSGLVIVDITDPANPVLADIVNTSSVPQDVVVAGNYAFVADFSGGLQVIDVSDPSNASIVATAPTGNARAVVVAGDHAFTAGTGSGLRVVDISDPTIPAVVGSYLISNAQGVFVSGNYAYVTDATDGFQVIDVSDPTNPTHVVTVDTPGFAQSFYVTGDYAFLADGSGGLRVYHVGNPASPTLLGSYTMSIGRDVAVAGDHAYVTDGSAGLQVLHVFQSEVDPNDNVGQSLVVDDTEDAIIRTRLVTTQTVGVSWEVSADAGANWQSIAPDNGWNAVSVPGSELLWRSTHTYAGTNPTVSNLHVEWLNEFAHITSISDIPNDQGKQVRVEWLRSGHDFVGDASQIVEYAVYRQIDPSLSMTTASAMMRTAGGGGPGAPRKRSFEKLSPAAREHALVMQAAGWDFLATVPVRVEDYYAVVVPTLADSTIAEGQYQTTFMVSAVTATPGVFYDSPPDSGYSIDNLAPSVPANFVISYNTGSGNTLAWDESPDADFQYFNVYRSSDPSFTPTPGDLVHSTTSTGFVDPENDGGAVYYKVTALDFSGNESDAATAGTVTAIPDDTPPDRWALYSNVFFNDTATTEIRYSVPTAGGEVSLRIYDVRGRLVRTLVSGHGVPGEQSVTWDGRDDRGYSVASGVYFYRLSAGGVSMTRKMVLTK